MKLHCPAFLLALLLTLPLCAAETSAPSEGRRFLFIIDTSLAMGRQSQTMPEEVMKLLQSGLQGRLSEGDTIGIWTYAETLEAGKMPLQQWKQNQGRVILARISDFLATRRYSGFAEFTVVTGRLLNLARESTDLTIFLISDGSHAVHGTPYDDAINKNFSAHGKEMRRLGVPFITALVIHRGEFAGHAVNSPFKPFRIPNIPPSIVKKEQQPALAPAVAKAKTEPLPTAAAMASPVTTIQPTASPVAPPTVAATRTVTVRAPGASPQNQLKIVEKWPAPDPVTKPEVSSTPTETPTRAVAMVQPDPAPTVPQAASNSITNSITPAAKTKPLEPQMAVVAHAPVTPVPATKVVARMPEPLSAQLLPEAVPAAAPVVLATVESSPFTTSGLMIAILVLLAVLIVLMLLMLRRARQAPQPSLITAYMDRNQMR